ncbi:MAG: endolytic transglycosylase MltG [Prevotellaceae bacterium]|jgi:UPF0755 protein|nr:endolytic transglycosylase MltG [Prevotellaceae bacterium]
MRNFVSATNSAPKTPASRALFLFGAVALGLALGAMYYFYDELYKPNVNVPDEGAFVYIPTGSTKENVVFELEKSGYIDNMSSLVRAMERLEYGRKIYPGKYKISRGLNNKKLVRILAAGMQTPVNLTIGSVRTRQRLAGIIARQIEPDSVSLLLAMRDAMLAHSYGFNVENFAAMFLPNTYQLYWNVSVSDFLKRMNGEWEKFWSSNDRDDRLKRTGLSRTEAVVLASIVSEETSKVDEMPTIAGVYINRLRKRMALQADPTVRFAVGDFSVRRILTAHTKIQSPYNTYRNRGLPPGPICIPSTRVIDAVLNYEEHDYIFFCARADFSGYHSFTKTYAQHMSSANAYQRALNRRSIFQ